MILGTKKSHSLDLWKRDYEAVNGGLNRVAANNYSTTNEFAIYLKKKNAMENTIFQNAKSCV